MLCMGKRTVVAKSYPPRVKREHVDGKRVVKDEVLRSNLPALDDGLPPAMHTTRVLTLEDGTVVYGCGDCETVGTTRGEIRKHRNQEHGLSSSTRRTAPAVENLAPSLPMPGAEMLGMTLYELLELSAAVDHWEQVFANQDAEIERLRGLLTEKEQDLAEQRRLLRTEERDHDRLRARISRLIGSELPAEPKTEATS